MHCAANIRHSAVLLATLTLSASAQSPNGARLLGWDSTLIASSAIAALPAFAEAPGGGAGTISVAETLWRLRRGELSGDRRELSQALRRTTLIEKQQRSAPWGYYLSARALLALWRAGAPATANEGQFEGEAYADAIWRHLHDALERDPAFGPARRMALDLLLAGGDRNLGRDQWKALDVLTRAAARDPDVLLVWGRELRRRGQLDSALARFGEAQRHGGDPGRVQLERARTLMALGQPAAAASAYWEGMQRVTPVTREAYRFDLAWILGADTLATFDAVPNREMADWLHRFWAERDAAAANLPGERLQEHLRRWVKAFRDYRVFIPDRRTQFRRVEYLFEGLDQCIGSDAALYETLARMQPTLPGDVRALEPLLDHRGLIYLRHGEPMQRIVGGLGATGDSIMPLDSTNSFSSSSLFRERRLTTRAELEDETRLKMRQNESWLYWFEGGWRLLHFRGSDALGAMAPTTLSGYLPVNGYFAEWQRRGTLLPEYAAAAARMAIERTVYEKSCIQAVTLAIKKSRDDAHTGTSSDSDTPPIRDPWNAVLQSFAVGTPRDGSARAVVTFAIPRARLSTAPGIDGQRVTPVQFRVVAYEAKSGKTIVLDTLRQFVIAGGAGDRENISGWLELPLTTGTWQVAVRLSQQADSVGAFGLQRGLVIPERSLAISDILTGIAGSPTRWPGDGAGFPLNTLGAWVRGGTVELYYQVHGLDAGTSYRTTMEIRPASGRTDRVVRLVSTERATGPLTAVRRSLALDKLPAGRHWVTVTVEEGGRTVTVRRAIVVIDP
jgi:tetratricopeptide (TPR) repeat protein